MKLRLFYSLFLIVVAVSAGNAQSKLSWKKRVKIANQMYEQGKFNQAAEYYRSAFIDQPKSLDLSFKAAECYYRIHDYENAAKCYEPIKNNNKEFDKPGYKYASCLMQIGNYEQAKKEFWNFQLTYSGPDYKAYEPFSQNGMDGCDFALEYDRKNKTTQVEVERLDNHINSDKSDFAPIPFQLDDKEVLYFSSAVDQAPKIYKSVKSDEGWSQKMVPAPFSDLGNVQFGNGSFTPNGNRFYFTECEVLPQGKSRCDIFLMEKDDKGRFGKPQKLPDFINTTGFTTTHPNVFVDDTREILVFSSDRPGGSGGMDLWYASKSVESPGTSFTLPINLGKSINTVQDEITPFYDISEQILYYSTNGLPGFGGFDIFKAGGSISRLGKPSNLGKPVNSSADDLYYTLKEFHNGGYLVSNRTFPPQKTTSTDDDIFSFGKKDPVAIVKGNVVCGDGDTTKLTGVKMILWEYVGDQKISKKDIVLNDNRYSFSLSKGRKYTIEASREEFRTAFAEVTTEDLNKPEEMIQNIALQKLPVMDRLVPRSANAAKPYRVPTSPPINTLTKEPYPEFSEEYKKWNELAEMAKKSKTGRVYYDDKGIVQVAEPMSDQPVIIASVDNTDSVRAGVPLTTTQDAKLVDNTPKPSVGKLPANKKTASGKTTAQKSKPATAESSKAAPARVFTPETVNEQLNKSKGNPWDSIQPGSPEEEFTEEGVTYRVQIAAVKVVKKNSYKKAAKIGKLYADETSPTGYTRIVIGTFDTIKKSREALAKLHEMGFEGSFISRYESGMRVGEGFQ